MGNAFDLGRLLVQDVKDETLSCKELKPGFSVAAKMLDEKGFLIFYIAISYYTGYIITTVLYITFTVDLWLLICF
jgi:hypothetical protein